MLNLTYHQMNNLLVVFCFALLCMSLSCSSDKQAKTTSYNVICREVAEPATLNPINGRDEVFNHVTRFVFATLIDFDIESGKEYPQLAEKLPELKIREDGLLEISFEIRKEALWDNGSPVTADDVELVVKTGLIPQVNCDARRQGFIDVKDFIKDTQNPKKFKIISAPYFAATSTWNALNIFPKYIYDADNMLAKYSVKQLSESLDKNMKDETLSAFANKFNDENFARKTVVGCGPYLFKIWKTGEKIALEKKKNWWGEKVKLPYSYFKNYPENITWQIIRDNVTAITALKAGNVDIMRSINPKDYFDDLKKDNEFLSKYNLYTPTSFVLEGIMLNTRNAILKDKKVRQALNYLTDKKTIIEQIMYNLSAPAYTFIHPSIKDLQNPNLNKYDFDEQKAKTLLAESGWFDTDNDGVLDKKINGKKVDFSLNILYPSGVERKENICLFYREACKKVGIRINIIGREFVVLQNEVAKGNFDMIVQTFGSSPAESDPRQLWHTAGIAKGTNYTGFGNAKSDSIIMKIRATIQRKDRVPYYFELQKMVNEESPFIYIHAQKGVLAISKKYEGYSVSGIRPGFWQGSFKLKNAQKQ